MQTWPPWDSFKFKTTADQREHKGLSWISQKYLDYFKTGKTWENIFSQLARKQRKFLKGVFPDIDVTVVEEKNIRPRVKLNGASVMVLSCIDVGP